MLHTGFICMLGRLLPRVHGPPLAPGVLSEGSPPVSTPRNTTATDTMRQPLYNRLAEFEKAAMSYQPGTRWTCFRGRLKIHLLPT